MLIELLRVRAGNGLEPQGLHEVSHLFLTFDHRLPMFASRMKEQRTGHKIPFCLMANEWLQILYFLRQGVSIDPTVFVSLLNSPYLQSYFSQRAVDRNIVRSIAFVMEKVGELRPQVARKVFVNRLLLKTLEDTGRDAATKEQLLRKVIASESRAEDERIQALLRGKDDDLRALRVRVEDLEKAKRETPSRPTVPSAPGRKQLRRLEEEVKALREAANANRSLREEVTTLQSDVRAARTIALTAQRILLVIPIMLVLLGVAELRSAQPDIVFGITTVALGALPLLVGVFQQFRGRLFELINNVASVLGVLAFLWEFFPGIKEAIRQILRLL